MSKGMLVGLGVVGVIVVALLLVGGSYVSAKNQMVAKDQTVKSAWSEVDVQLQRRADLIPNLVETVKGFTKEENSVFAEIANARAGMLNAQTPQSKIAANGQLDGALGRLLLLTENYPQLRSSEQFMRLQDELAGTENRIGVARRTLQPRRSRTTTRSFGSFRTASGRGWRDSIRMMRTSRRVRRRSRCRT